jgi:predicted DsbA family dithiol-disulfide isomerase
MEFQSLQLYLLTEITRMGITAVPALIINGQVKCAGTAPSRHQIKVWLTELCNR